MKQLHMVEPCEEDIRDPRFYFSDLSVSFIPRDAIQTRQLRGHVTKYKAFSSIIPTFNKMCKILISEAVIYLITVLAMSHEKEKEHLRPISFRLLAKARSNVVVMRLVVLLSCDLVSDNASSL